jgi:hypothetical protein
MLESLRQEIFSYTKNEEELDMESPRVKNVPLKAYFCLPYFLVIYIKLAEKITKEEECYE